MQDNSIIYTSFQVWKEDDGRRGENDSFIHESSSFLACGVSFITFSFLEISIGANPRRRATWQPILNKLHNRLALWKGKHFSLRGRVVMINFVLNSLPIYLFSFYKAPKVVLVEIEKIQRAFLWGGTREKRKVNWVSWSKVCRHKKE